MDTDARQPLVVDTGNPEKFEKIPRHIAIIMDGNGRWAQKRGLDRAEGHRAGVQALKPIVKESAKLGVQVLTVYAFSTENWSRPQIEVNALWDLLVEYLRIETPELKSEGVRIQTIGNVDALPSRAQKAIDGAKEDTREQTRMVLNLALNYGGRDELVRAVNRWLDECRPVSRARYVTASAIAEHLDTAGLPDPDLLIRSSGELRISNFLLWQLAYAEIYVTNTLWPDFNPMELRKAIRAYQQRDRRFGGLRE
ncbi:MAG: isoprenyl transferase [Firmicutes bacterium]|nr:isoprenyl transferase [Bacillota bacterium]